MPNIPIQITKNAAGAPVPPRTVVWDKEKWEILKLIVADAPEHGRLHIAMLADRVSELVQHGFGEEPAAGIVLAALDAVEKSGMPR